MEHDLEKAKTMKLILSAFDKLSGLKINFYKSDLYCFCEAQNDAHLYAKLFGCGQGQFLINYLGIPIHYRCLTVAEWKLVEERLQKRLNSWKGKLLSLVGRLVLINSVLTNMVLYMISFFQLPKGVLTKVYYFRSKLFWQGDSEKKKYRLARWNVVCLPKEYGGLGIHDLQVKTPRFWANGFLNYLRKMVYGKPCYGENMWDPKLCLKWFGNPVIYIFGQVLWPPKNISFVLVLLILRIDHRSGFRKISDLAKLLLLNNIQLYIRLSDTKGIQFPK